MKLGLIADIHDDLDALTLVLDRFDNIHKVDHILCAGDIIGFGYNQPNEVIELIQERNIIAVRGNHDVPLPSIGVTPENTLSLWMLGYHWRGEFAGFHLLLCHGLSGIPFRGFSPYFSPDEDVQKLLVEQSLDIMVVGHTHKPGIRRVKRGIIVNPGALYFESESHSYGILELPSLKFTLYDILSSANPISK